MKNQVVKSQQFTFWKDNLVNGEFKLSSEEFTSKFKVW